MNDKDTTESLRDRLTDPAFPPALKYQLSEKLMKAILFDEPKPMINGLVIRLKDCGYNHATIEISLVDKSGATLMSVPDSTVTKQSTLTLFDIKKMFEVKVSRS